MGVYRKVDDHYEFRVDAGRLVLAAVGAGLVLCLVFLLGVLVGRGLWADARRPAPVAAVGPVEPAPPEPAPPVPGPRQPELTFYKGLKEPSGAGPALARPEPKPAPPPVAATPVPAAPMPPASEIRPVVRPDAPEPKPEPPSRRTEPATKPQPAVFTVQVGSFRDRASAERLASRVSAQGARARVLEAVVAGRTWYRVQVGRFGTRKEAEDHYRRNLKSKGIQGFVTTR